MGRWIAVAAVTVACLVSAPLGKASGAAGREVRVTDLTGLERAIDAYKGQALLINFWASWCEPCLDELPELIDIANEFRPKGVAVVTVSYDLLTGGGPREDVVKDVGAFVAEQKMDLPVFIYDGPDEDISQRFGLPGAVPVTIAIDRTGKVVERHVGRATRARFSALIQHALRTR